MCSTPEANMIETGRQAGFNSGLPNSMGDTEQWFREGVTGKGNNFLQGGLNPNAYLYNKYLKGSGPDHTASNLRAKIAREQWEDYKTRFRPLEDKLLGLANNRNEFITKNREQAVGSVDSAYNQAPDQINRRLTSYGVQVTPEMQDRIGKTLGLQKSLSEVQASNMSDRLSKDQLQGIVGGGLFTGNRSIQTSKQVGN